MSRMTLSDQIEIEAGIYARKSLSEIAEQIHKSRRYVSEELRRNATKIPGEHPLGKRCRNATGCRRGSLCGKENCHQMCYTCKEVDCQTVCKAYYHGVELLMQKLLARLDGLGVVPMDSLGKCFNPDYHEAVEHVEDPARRQDEIVQVIQTGFTMDDEIIRHAKVVVAN